ncbi:MAG: methyltransferase [Oscillospiraceae bacterium]|nr:methyltransferase [Oscillospiraceae bacterium]
MTDSYLLHNGTRVYTDSDERPSLASFMLAYFAQQKGSKKILELCSGAGTVSFWNYDRGFIGRTVMVDLREDQLKLAERTAAEGGFDVTAVKADAAAYKSEERFDCVICNPPFFDEKDRSEDPDRNAVRHENGLSPDALFASAAMNLKQRGHLFICHVPDRLPDLFESLRKNGFEPKTLRFCRHSAERLPFLVLIDAIYKGGKKLTVMPDLCVFGSDGKYTDELMDICEEDYV